MITTDTQVPAWLNLDAFELPEDAIENITKANGQLHSILPMLDQLLARADRADTAIEAAVRGQGLPDDVSEAVFNFNGREELWNLLGVIQSMCELITGSSGLMDPYFTQKRKEWGLDADWAEETPWANRKSERMIEAIRSGLITSGTPTGEVA